MRSRRAFREFSVLAAVVAAVAFAGPARADCVAMKGTADAQLDVGGPQGPGWYGHAYLSFGNHGPVRAAAIYTAGLGYSPHPSPPSGNFAGNEIMTLTFDNGDTLVIALHFMAMPGATPYWYQLSETGEITSGTGEFAGVSGHSASHGSFVVGGGLAAGPSPEHPWIYMGQTSATVCLP